MIFFFHLLFNFLAYKATIFISCPAVSDLDPGLDLPTIGDNTDSVDPALQVPTVEILVSPPLFTHFLDPVFLHVEDVVEATVGLK